MIVNGVEIPEHLKHLSANNLINLMYIFRIRT